MKTKKIFALLLALIMIVSLCACGSNADAESPGQDTSTAPADDEVYRLICSIHDSATSTKGKYMQEWCDAIKEASNGRLVIELYAGGALAAANTVLDVVKSGAADIGMLYTMEWENNFSKLNILTLPMMGIPNAEIGTRIQYDVYENCPEAAAELNNEIKTLHMYSNGVNMLFFGKEPTPTFDAITKMTLGVNGGNMTKFFTACGINSITVSGPDTYETVQKGIIDGHAANGAQMNAWALDEVDHFILDMPIFSGCWLTVMNAESYNKLPADLQAILDEYSGLEYSLKLAQYCEDDNTNSYDDAVANSGMAWVEISDEEVAKFVEAAEGTKQEWIQAQTTGDFDANAYYGRINEIIAKYN